MRRQVFCLADTNVNKTVLVPDFTKLKVCHGKQTGITEYYRPTWE